GSARKLTSGRPWLFLVAASALRVSRGPRGPIAPEVALTIVTSGIEIAAVGGVSDRGGGNRSSRSTGHLVGADRRAFHMTDFAEFRAQRQPADAAQRQRREDGDAVAQILERGHERGLLLNGLARDRRRIFDAPVRRHRLARPDRASFAGRAVADGEDEIELGSVRPGELVPRFRTIAVRRVLE